MDQWPNLLVVSLFLDQTKKYLDFYIKCLKQYFKIFARIFKIYCARSCKQNLKKKQEFTHSVQILKDSLRSGQGLVKILIYTILNKTHEDILGFLTILEIFTPVGCRSLIRSKGYNVLSQGKKLEAEN